jgi:hypothetical protein
MNAIEPVDTWTISTTRPSLPVTSDAGTGYPYRGFPKRSSAIFGRRLRREG